jgi:putative glutamine amidotransferase
MRRPRIGICTVLERARWSVWDQEAVLLPRSYTDAIQRAGGLAVMLPPDPQLLENPDEALDFLDALVLAGGADVDPANYGAEAHTATVGTVPERDRFEMALVLRAMDRDLPFLGICRGMQVMNVARGGTLIQHLPDDVGHHDHRRKVGTFDESDHDVRLQSGSLAARAAAETTHNTKSHHHQAVAELGQGLKVTGWATVDDLPEAIEDPTRSFALGVQWHPEVDETSRIVRALVDEARTRMNGAG